MKLTEFETVTTDEYGHLKPSREMGKFFYSYVFLLDYT